MSKFLTNDGRSVVAQFLLDQPHRRVLCCEEGFLDSEEGVPVSDAVAIEWVEKSGGKLSELFQKHQAK